MEVGSGPPSPLAAGGGHVAACSKPFPLAVSLREGEGEVRRQDLTAPSPATRELRAVAVSRLHPSPVALGGQEAARSKLPPLELLLEAT